MLEVLWVAFVTLVVGLVVLAFALDIVWLVIPGMLLFAYIGTTDT